MNCLLSLHNSLSIILHLPQWLSSDYKNIFLFSCCIQLKYFDRFNALATVFQLYNYVTFIYGSHNTVVESCFATNNLPS